MIVDSILNFKNNEKPEIHCLYFYFSTFYWLHEKEMPEIVTDFVGATVYYVSNETEIDLDVTYRIAETTIGSTVIPFG